MLRNFKKFITIKKILFFSGLLAACPEIFAGSINLTPLNYNTSGLYYSTSGGTFVSDLTGFYTTTTPVQWTIGSYNIRNGQTWATLAVSATSTGGTYDVYIYSSSQVVLYSQTALSTNASVDLTAITALAKGAPFYVKLVLNVNVKVTQVTATFAGNQITCYPSPYQISLGQMKMVFDVNTNSKATLQIYDNRGRLVKTVLTDKAVTALNSRFDSIYTWDGTDDNGRVINTGIYTVVVRVTPDDASKTAEKYISTFRILVFR